MRICLVFIFLLVGCATSSSGKDAATTPTQKIHLVDAIFDAIQKNYAPLKIKSDTYGFNLEKERSQLRNAILKDPLMPDAELRARLHQLFASLRDAHSGIFFRDNQTVWLGFAMKSIGPKYYISWIDRGWLPKAIFAADVGDEVVKINGQNISDVYASIAQQSGFRVSPLGERTFNEWYLTYRSEGDVGQIPSVDDIAKIAVRDSAGEVKVHRAKWLNETTHPPTVEMPYWGGSKSGYIPYLGEGNPQEAKSLTFRNYTFAQQGVTYGYIRIPTLQFSGEGQLKALAEFNRIIDRFNSMKVEKLILDFTGNGGGNYLLAFGMLSRLTDKKLHVPRQRYFVGTDYAVIGVGTQSAIRAELKKITDIETQSGAKRYLKKNAVFSSALAFEPKNLKTLQRYRRFLEDLSHAAVQAKEGGLTEPLPQYFPFIEPAKNPFTGKILVLTDEMTISAPEFAAAALLDNGRAQTFGATTLGAGGDQRCFLADAETGRAPELFQLKQEANLSALMKEAGISKFCVTATVGLRVNAKGDIIGPFENFGVPASVTYTVTHDDLISGFQGYKAALLKSLQAL